MNSFRSLPRACLPFVGILGASLSAALASLASRGSSSKEIVLVLYLPLILILALRWGRLAGTIVTIVAGIFARSLFPPIGSFAIQDMHQRSDLGRFVLAGVVATYLIAPDPTAGNRPSSSRGPASN